MSEILFAQRSASWLERLRAEFLPHLNQRPPRVARFTDTFGMAVLEAQACGLPAVVSDVGGPQEILAADGRSEQPRATRRSRVPPVAV